MDRLPWDFVVPGTPVSINSKNKALKARWKAAVASAASMVWPDGHPLLTDNDLEISITHYHDSATPLDVDNSMKLIQDALSGVIYLDDKQLVTRHSYLLDLNGTYRVRGKMSAELGRGFSFDAPFVHVKISRRADPQELP